MISGGSVHNHLSLLRTNSGRGLSAPLLDRRGVNDRRAVASQTIIRRRRSGDREALSGNDISRDARKAARDSDARHTWGYVPCSEPPENPHSRYRRGWRHKCAREVRRGCTRVSLEGRPCRDGGKEDLPVCAHAGATIPGGRAVNAGVNPDIGRAISTNIILICAELSPLGRDALQLLLGGSVRVPNLHQHSFFANGSTVVLPDDVFALIASLESVQESVSECVKC